MTYKKNCNEKERFNRTNRFEASVKPDLYIVTMILELSQTIWRGRGRGGKGGGGGPTNVPQTLKSKNKASRWPRYSDSAFKPV